MKDYDGSESARRFFVNCEQEFKGLSTHSWIYAVEACFVGKAATWISQQSEIQDILDLEEPTEQDKARFCHLVKQKYPDRKPPTHKQWMTQLKELKQDENDESLGQYYRRTYEILRGLGGQDKEKDDDDGVLSLSEITVLDHIIEKFVNGLNDSQLRCKMRYKYLATSGRYLITSEWSLYGAYEAAEQISSYITTKKEASSRFFDEQLLKILQRQGTEAALKFGIENRHRLESYTQKPKSIPVDRIERYRPQQHKKPESTMQKKIAKKKLTQPYTDSNSSDSNVSALGRISGGSQTTPHSDSSISENMIALSSQLEPLCDPVSNEQVIRPGKSTMDESYASGPRKWAASTRLPEIPVVNESPLILEEVPCNLSEISTSVDVTNTESPTKPIASKFTSLQKPLHEISTVYESPSILQEKPYQMQESCSIPSRSSPPVSPSRISKPWLTQNWRARPLPEISIVDESPPVLEQIPPEISETNAAIVDISDTESKKDEILASGPSNWTAASAEKEEVFESTRISDESLKSPSASHIEAEEVAKSIVDVETQNQEVFALDALYDTFSKNPPAPYSEDTEISIAVDMLSLEHLINEDNSATGAFDSVTGIATFSKNPLIQHTEDSETLEKDSVYTYELPALPVFDLSIDIDFEAYTTDSVTYSSTHSSASSSPLSPSTSSITLQATEATTSYEREQSSTCSVERIDKNDREVNARVYHTTSGYGREQSSTCSAGYMTSCYEGEQVTCSADTATALDIEVTKPEDTTITKSTVTKPVVHHALLVYCLAWIQHITLPFCMVMWMTIYDYAALLDLTTDYKARPKVKIKRLLEPKHIVSRNQQTIAGIFAQFTYKIALFSDCRMRMQNGHLLGQFNRGYTSGISAVFAYKLDLFSGSMEGLETFESEVFDPAYDFGISGLQNSHLVPCNCDEGKALLLWIFGILRYLFYESHCFTHTTCERKECEIARATKR
ncbi:hypothetical protein G7Y79_00016g040510 [Physcia stellaris]|nr:hypothetical protein G7Y79_00016g040510 [Physcia stellaris]